MDLLQSWAFECSAVLSVQAVLFPKLHTCYNDIHNLETDEILQKRWAATVQSCHPTMQARACSRHDSRRI